MPALSGKIIKSCRKKSFLGSLLKSCHIGIKFFNFASSACTIYEIISSVIVKKKRSVMIHSIDLGSSPFAVFNIRSLVKVGFSGAITAEKYIVKSSAVTQTCSPLSVWIVIFSVLQILLASISVCVKNIVAYFPWHKIFGLHYRCSRTEIHRSADHVVGVSNTNDILIRNICPYYWIGYRYSSSCWR